MDAPEEGITQATRLLIAPLRNQPSFIHTL